MTNDTTYVVEADDLTKTFRDFWRRPQVRAVDAVQFKVKKGEVFGLLGPNGSGKSTTLKMVLGLLFPTRGRLQVLSASPRDIRIKARIGYLPEESYLYPYLNPTETLNFFGRLFDLSKPQRRRRIEELIEMVGLSHARHRQVGDFSKGMARRVGLAQALINDPDLVILDEPTSGLDPIGCRQMKDLIVTLARRGKSVLLSSHLLADVEDVCDRVAILYNGRIRASGTLNELLRERNRCVLTVPEMTPEALGRLQAVAREEAGVDGEVSHPRQSLERFFLDVVQEAKQAETHPPGEREGGGVADYLQAADPSSRSDEQEDRTAIDRRLERLVSGGPRHPTAEKPDS